MSENIHPISFSIHESKIISDDDFKNIQKTKLFAEIRPRCGLRNWDQFKTEESYYNDYRISYFGHTCKKAGWDCMRHYEILANGCIPYFKDLDKCPETTMTTLPKQLIKEGMQLFNLNEVDTEKYNNKVLEILQYMRLNTTTKQHAKKFLDVFSKDIKSILVLTNNGRVDYTYNTLLIGLKELLGPNVVDAPRVPPIYDNYPIEKCPELYGRGFSYSRVLPSDYDVLCNRENILQRIKDHEFDLIINTYDCEEDHEGLRFIIREAQKYYKNDEIVYVCGHDCDAIQRPALFHERHDCPFKNKAKDGFHVFIRELGH